MKRTFLLFTGILVCAALIGQNSANLRMNPEKNKVYRLRSTSDQTIVQTVNGNQQTIESVTSYTVSLRMVDATDAFIVTEVRFDTMATKTNSMGKISIMSSASEGNIKSEETSEIISCIMNRLSKNPVYAKLDFTGKVTEIVNGKMLAGMILKDTSSIVLTAPVSTAVKEQIVNMVSDNSLKTMIEMFTYNLPGKPVNRGDKWSFTSSMNAGGMSLDIATGYQLEGISGSNAIVTAESNISPSPNALPMQQGGATITYDDLKGLSKSTITIDSNTGLLVESSSKTRITGNLGVSVPGMNMQIPMDINSNSKIVSLQ